MAFALGPTLGSFLGRPAVSISHSLSHCAAPLVLSRRPRLFPQPIRTRTVSSAAFSSSATAKEASPYAEAKSDPVPAATPMSFQDAILRLQQYWASKGCIIWHPYNVEVGAGTMNPATFLRVLGPEPWSVAYDEPSIRPDDSRYGENPNRLQRHTQFQVILKPAPDFAPELVVGSYQALGIDTTSVDIRFVEDNWESPALGAWGLGWEIWLNGMEVTQFTYFQQAGGLPLNSVAVEITYGLERILMSLQRKTHFKNIVFSPGITYGEIFMQNEVEMSRYNMDEADIPRNKQLFEICELEAIALLEKRLPVPAYNYVLKASHTFNILDARGAIGVTERARYFQRMRALARDVARLWVERREELNFPLMSQDKQVIRPTAPPPTSHVCDSKPTADFVFEIGVEELPASDVADSIAQVYKLMTGLLSEARLSYSSVDVNGTPRRVSAFIRDLQTRQFDESKKVRGPSLRAALKDGVPTKAATGFIRSQGADEDTVEYNEEEGYMYATVHQVGRPAEDVIVELLPKGLLAKINFGKSMRWNDTGIAFSRPMRWMLSLLDNNVVPLEFAGVVSSDTTRSLRGSEGFAEDVPLGNATNYHATLKKLEVMLSREERSGAIRKQSVQLAEEIGAIIPEEFLEGPLLEEVTDLVENPIPLRGSFDQRFLDLPPEVLKTVMTKHQRYFPVVDPSSGKLVNSFITVANGHAALVDVDAIRSGNEAVLRARYADAAFFYERDTTGKNLKQFVSSLSEITFQESLGSLWDKTNRVSSSVPVISEELGLDSSEVETAKQVAVLYKADLATSMVMEMTSLAGVIGRHYCQKSGEASRDVSEGIFEASLPRFSGDQVAASKPGAVVAITDRIDSLVGLFSVGLIPKSTADPFALRRAAFGVVQTILAMQFDVDVLRLVSVASVTITEQTGEKIPQEVQDSVVDFICKRLEGYLLDGAKISDDVVKAVLAVPSNARNPVTAFGLCEAIVGMRTSNPEKLAQAQQAHCRAARLVASVKTSSTPDLLSQPIDETVFDCEQEQALWNDLQTVGSAPKVDTIQEHLEERVQSLVSIKPQVDAFFDEVFVNAEDERARQNRLSLSARVSNILGCDLDPSFLNL